jgi:hypothetical protein
MFPFLAGAALALVSIGKKLANTPSAAWWLLPIVFLDPVMAGQSALMGPDSALACFFLITVSGLLTKKEFRTIVGILGLCSISMRGMMTAGALFVWQILLLWPVHQSLSKLVRLSLCFLPGFGFACWFLWWHYTGTGWIGYHPDSPWARAFAPVAGSELVRNVLVVGWRWVDFGRVFEWFLLGFLLFSTNVRTLLRQSGKQFLLPLLLLLACLLVFLLPSSIFYQNLSAHRYFLPCFLCFHLLIFHWVALLSLKSWKKNLLFALLVLGLASGNFWIYPRGISMGWDSTLAHLPYHRLRTEMAGFIDAKNIPYSSIGTAFPNINTGENLYLNRDHRSFSDINWQQNKYMLVSNIFNDVSESDYKRLEQQWVLLKDLRRSGIWLRLYKKPE